jgi:predicted transcriptional regulator
MENGRRKIKVKEVVHDITAGVTDPQLMDRYGLNSNQLEFLLQQLLNRGFVSQQQLDARVDLADTAVTKAFSEVQHSIEELDDDAPTIVRQRPAAPRKEKGKIRVKAKEIVRDIRDRLTDVEIMYKYGMNEKQFEFILRQLVDTGRIAADEVYGRASLSRSSISRAFLEVYQFLQELED